MFCSTVNAQISTYNKGLKTSNYTLNAWYLDNSAENFATKQTPVGYKASYDELKKILAYYDLDIMEADMDESLIDENIEGLRDFRNLSNSLLLENSGIKMAWRTNDNYQIYWACTETINVIFITKIK